MNNDVPTLDYALRNRRSVARSRTPELIILMIGLACFAEYVFEQVPPLGGTMCTRSGYARAAIGSNGTISQAIDLFKFNVGRDPKSLDELFQIAADDPDRPKWTGPYLRSKAALKDPWGNAYHYDPTAKLSGIRYDLWSNGPNGVDESSNGDSNYGDDIRNWK